MLKFHRLSVGTLDRGVGVINTFELYSDEDDKMKYNIEISFCRDGGCECRILTSHLDKHLDILLQQFGECFVDL